MNEFTEERLAGALELIGTALGLIAKIMERDSYLKYPEKKPPTEPTVTYIPTDEERLKEDQGQTGESTTQEWTSLGPRERAFAEKEKADSERTTRATTRDLSR